MKPLGLIPGTTMLLFESTKTKQATIAIDMGAYATLCELDALDALQLAEGREGVPLRVFEQQSGIGGEIIKGILATMRAYNKRVLRTRHQASSIADRAYTSQPNTDLWPGQRYANGAYHHPLPGSLPTADESGDPTSAPA